MLATDIPIDISASTVLYPVAMVALGALVKWWMAGTQRSIKELVDDFKKFLEAQGVLSARVGVLEALRTKQEAEIDRLRDAQHELRNSVNVTAGKCELKHRMSNE